MADEAESTLRLSLAEAHRRAQSLLAAFDAGREVGYPELADELFALCQLSFPIVPSNMGEIACENADIWERISRKSASLVR